MKGSHKNKEVDSESVKRKRQDKERALNLRRKRQEKTNSKEPTKLTY
jgi:hypothetical protein